MSTYKAVTTAGPRAPMRAREREDVVSRTPFLVRERIAWVRCYLYEHPRRVNMAFGAAAALVVEHHETVAPRVQTAAVTAGHAVATLWSWLPGGPVPHWF